MPEVFTVITINYNNLKGLMRTVDSVLCQSARNAIQFVVVDGASTDGSVEYLNSLTDKIDVLISEKDGGIYDAMNKGIVNATGDYIWFVNSGDAIYKADTAHKLLDITKEKPDIIFGDTMFIDSEGNEIGLISKLKPQPLPQRLKRGSFRYGMNVCHQSFIVKRELAPKYDLQYRQAADIDWIIQILNSNPSSVRYNDIISCFETGGSSYQNEKKAWKERYLVLSKHYGLFSNLLAHIWIVLRRGLFKLGIWKP